MTARPGSGLAALLAANLLLGACSTLDAGSLAAGERAGLPAVVELAEVPFFAQEVHECGPAALAELLDDRGLTLTPEDLSREVYLPGREGSLAPELVAGVRRHGLLPELLPPRLPALLQTVAAGRPALVLLNLGLDWWPLWHYAVVVGYDLGHDEILLRSGAERRQTLSLYTFGKTWQRGGGFALTALQAGEAPLFSTAERWVQTLADAHAPRAAWEQAAQRWPDSAPVAFGLANARLQGEPADLPGAAQALRDTLRLAPDFLPAYNNLALVLARQGDWSEARRVIGTALERLGAPAADGRGAALRAALEDTRRQILSGRLDPAESRTP